MAEEQKSSNFWRYALIALIFSIIGATAVLGYNNLQAKKQTKQEESKQETQAVESETQKTSTTSTQTWEEIDLSQPSTEHSKGTSSAPAGGGKFTIIESKNIYSDK